MPNAIVIGATSGIGQALAEQLANAGWAVGLTGRRAERLHELKATLPGSVSIQLMDICQPALACEQLHQLIESMQGMDLLIICAGISHRNASWEQEQAILNTNVTGFAAMARFGFEYFCKKGSGHLVGISSISALRGRAENVAYSATKAFVSNYLQGLRQKATRLQKTITITEILAGWVNTPLIRGGGSKRFWVASVEQAARQIVHAIEHKKDRAYVTRRWRFIAWFLTFIPDFIHKKL